MAVIGIDLGTTYSASAVSIDGTTARILTNQEGKNTTPSVVFFPFLGDGNNTDEPLVGDTALNSAASPDNLVRFIKRMMGDPDYLYTSPNGVNYHPEEISAIILKYIKQYSELALGEPVTDAVITVPAYFDDARRTATKQAGKLAGLNVLQVFNEPTAAAIAYGLSSKNNGRVLVYDLGGGTFDITLMDVHDGNFDVVATDGDPNLGGFDFDNALADLIIADLAAQGYEVDEYDDALNAQIRDKAENMKRALTNVEKNTAIFTIEGKTYRVCITRQQFEAATATLLKRTQERLEVMMENQNVQWQDIDYLLMIGGSTRMPMVREMLERLSGRKLKHEINPDEAVALGAGIYARQLADQGSAAADTDVVPGAVPSKAISISDVTSQSLGVIVNDSDNPGHQINSIIIPNNTKIPAKAAEVYFTVVPNQTEIRLRVTEGNDTELDYVKIIGEKLLRIPPHPENSPIRVTYSYDIDQTVFVEVEDLTDNQSLGTFDIDRTSNLSDSDVSQLAEKMNHINVQ